MNRSRIQLMAVTLLCAGVVSGCATRGDIDALRSEMQNMQKTTEESLSMSREAREIAANNRSEIASVSRATTEAQRQAQEANERVDRAFDASLRK